MVRKDSPGRFDGALFVSFLTGLFYVAGNAFFSGKMSFYGINTSLIDMTFSDSMYLGFYVISAIAMTAAYYVFVSMSILSVLVFIVNHAEKKPWFSVPTVISSFFDGLEVNLGPISSIIDKIHARVSAYSIVALVAFSLVFISTNFFTKCGERSAKDYYKSVVGGGEEKSKLKITTNGMTYYVNIIQCSPEYCAVIFRKSGAISILRRDDFFNDQKIIPFFGLIDLDGKRQLSKTESQVLPKK